MSKRESPVPRPLKRTEWEIFFDTRDDQKGWTDLLATARNATTEAWNTLTCDPLTETARLYQLKADFAYLTRNGRTYARYQYKVTGGGRIWFYVDPTPKGSRAKSAGRVFLERCDTAHPKETES